MKKKSIFNFFLILLFCVQIFYCDDAESASEALMYNKQDIDGIWQGLLYVGSEQQTIGFKFNTGQETEGVMDMEQQGLRNAALSNINIKYPKVYFELRIGNALNKFNAELRENVLTGNFEQLNVESNMVVKGSFYVEKKYIFKPSISLQTGTGTLYGTLEMPQGEEPFPVALIVPEYLETDRDGNRLYLSHVNNCLKYLAQELLKLNIASLRYDKRGTGQSFAAIKKREELTFDLYIEDAVSWINILKQDFRFNKICVIGYGEGSLVGMIAAQKAGVDAFISISGIGRPPGEVLLQQIKSVRPEIYEDSIKIVEQLKKGNTVAAEKLSPALMAFFPPVYQNYYKSYFKYDPAVEIGKLHIPILILNGDNNLQVSLKESELLYKANPGADFKIIKGMNWVLKIVSSDSTENERSYLLPDIPISDALVKVIADFIAGPVK